MEADTRSEHGAAVAVVARIVDVLQVEPGGDSAPHVRVVVSLDNIFAAVVQPAVTEQKAQASEGQIFLMVGGNAIRNEYAAQLVLPPMP